MIHSPLPCVNSLVVVTVFCCLLITCQVAVSFRHVPSPALRLPSTSSAKSIVTVRQPSSLSISNEKIEVEDFEEYARCMSPREVSSEVPRKCIMITHAALSGSTNP